MMRLAADFRAIRDVELALHVPVVGDAVAPFMTSRDTDPAALRAKADRRQAGLWRLPGHHYFPSMMTDGLG
jgi:hypothetical protein